MTMREMANSMDQAKLTDEPYTVLLQDDENMRARINALLNQINEDRVKVKELHAEYAIKFGEIALFANRLDDMLDGYDGLLAQSLARRDELLELIEKAKKSSKQL